MNEKRQQDAKNRNGLLPCPHCGSTDVEQTNDTGPDDDYFVEWIECRACGATAKTPESWNRRSKPGRPALPDPRASLTIPDNAPDWWTK